MKTEDFIKDLRDRFNLIADGFGKAVADVHAIQVDRIFTLGKDANGMDIGSYNTVSGLYVNPDNSPKKFPTKGKTGESVFKTGKKAGMDHVTGWFESYQAFRGAIGRETGFVNLTLSGLFRRDYADSLTRIDAFRYAVGVKSDINEGKALGAVDKYGEDVFDLTNEESEKLITRINEEREKLGL